jgi:hypothetical protein
LLLILEELAEQEPWEIRCWSLGKRPNINYSWLVFEVEAEQQLLLIVEAEIK